MDRRDWPTQQGRRGGRPVGRLGQPVGLTLDPLDQAILDARDRIEADHNRPSVRAIAGQLGCPRSTIHERVARLKNDDRWPTTRPEPPRTQVPADVVARVQRWHAAGMAPADCWRACQARGDRISRATITRLCGPAKAVRWRRQDQAEAEAALAKAARSLRRHLDRPPRHKELAAELGWPRWRVEKTVKRLRAKGYSPTSHPIRKRRGQPNERLTEREIKFRADLVRRGKL